MAVLGAKMAEEDEAFWNHETWADDDDSGNESFHDSDEDSVLKKDVFDSDFNDSESDNEDEEVAAGEAEEREIRKSERASKSMAYKFPGAKLGGQKRGRRGFPGGAKRVIGEGSNAGIVLNLPLGSHDSLAYIASIEASHSALPTLAPMQTQQFTVPQSIPSAVALTDTKTAPIATNSLQQPTIAPPTIFSAPLVTAPNIKAKDKTKPAPIRKQTRSMKVSVRESRSTHGPRKLRGRGDTSASAKAQTPITSTRSSKASGGNTSDSASRAFKRKKYSQEELLLEAVHETEPENQRWLYGRKRVMDQHNQNKDSNILRDQHRGKKVIQKFHSRRGCLITLTFPEMDAVPEILTRRHESTKRSQEKIPPIPGGVIQQSAEVPSLTTSKQQQQQQCPTLCVITGKNGKYKDPLTKFPYHDLAAFKELRRRHKEGIPIVSKRAVASAGVKQSSDIKTAPKTARGGKNKRTTNTVIGGSNNKKASIGTNEGATKLKRQSPKNLPNTNGTNAKAPSKGTTSPSSPRRLSARKWKPSEKILETISMLPGKTDGNIPRGLGIQPALPVVPSLNSNNNTATNDDAVVAVPLSSTVLAPKLQPPETSLSTSTKGNIPPTQTEEIPSNGASREPASSSKTSSIIGSAAPVTSVQSKEKAATNNGQGGTLIETKVEESSKHESAKTGTAIDKQKGTGQNGGRTENPEPKQ